MLHILGVDLAWGNKNLDGVCSIGIKNGKARLEHIGLSKGDSQLTEWIQNYVDQGSVLAMFDAPLICRNKTGSRPVDRASHRHFGKYKAGCYPVNQQLCKRPLKISDQLNIGGFIIDSEIPRSRGRFLNACEVYPHIALIRWFNLPKRIKYKKGNLVQKNRGFSELKSLLFNALESRFFAVENLYLIQSLFDQPWSKNSEDQVDALICALIGYWHWKYRGELTEILGDLDTGFIVIPKSQTSSMT